MPKTGYLYVDLIRRQYKVDKMAKFLEIKSINPKLKHSEVAKEFKRSSSQIQRYSTEKNMLSPYRIPTSSNTRKEKTPNTNHDDVQMTSNDLKKTSNDLEMTSNVPVKNRRNKLRGSDPINLHISGKELIKQAFSSN